MTAICLSPEKLLEAHSISTTWLPLESFLPPSGRNGKVSRLGEICASAVPCKCLGRANRLLRAKIKFDRVINSGYPTLAMRWLSTGAREPKASSTDCGYPARIR